MTTRALLHELQRRCRFGAVAGTVGKLVRRHLEDSEDVLGELRDLRDGLEG